MFDFSKFYQGLLNRTDYFNNYWDQFPIGRKKRYKTEVLSLLRENVKNKDEKGLSCTLSVAFFDGADRDYTGILLSLLEEEWHTLEEDIVEVLGLTKDPMCIKKLYELAINVPDYDDGRAMAKKCILALGAINTAESKEKLSLLKESDDPIIKQAAIDQLEYNAKLS